MLSQDLSKGLERHTILAASNLPLTPSDEHALSSWSYITSNKLTLKEHEADIPDLNAVVTIAEAIHSKQAEQAASSSSKARSKDPRPWENPAQVRKQLMGGLAFPVKVDMTQRKGWSVFTKAFIPKGECGAGPTRS